MRMTEKKKYKRVAKPTEDVKGLKNISYLAGNTLLDVAYPKDSKLAKAYEVALDTRKFEIDLYWKRAAYFWAIAAVILGAIGLLVTNAIKDNRLNSYPILFMLETLSCIGFIVTKAWQYVNLGGKFWQVNWELHVDILEEQVLFPLFRTVVTECPNQQKSKNSAAEDATVEARNAGKNNDNYKKLTPVFSPSKVNEYLGRFINTIFIAIGASALVLVAIKAWDVQIGMLMLKHTWLKPWLISATAAIPLLYTFIFWIRIAGNARTTTLRKHSLNVTQRDFQIIESIELPEKKKKGFRHGFIQVMSEMNPARYIK